MPRVNPHRNITLTKEDSEILLKESGALFLRYTDEWDRKEESDFWYIVKDEFQGMAELSSNTRNQIRKGQKYCSVKKVTGQEVANKGFETYKRAFDNYDTHLKPMSQKVFYDNMIKATNYDFFAVYKKEDGEMIAYSSNTIDDDVCSYTTIKLHPLYLKLYPGYTLLYEMNKYYLQQKGFKYVHDGARSISHSTNIHTFLLQKFKFRKAYCRLNVAYRWDVDLAVKLLYPLRRIVEAINYPLANRISVVLKQEEIRRSFGLE